MAPYVCRSDHPARTHHPVSDTPSRPTTALAGRYRIERELGAGGTATVYLAHNLRHDREVEVKVMLSQVCAELAADRVLLESSTSARLPHPHIVPVFDSGDADGQLFFVMPPARACPRVSPHCETARADGTPLHAAQS